MVQLTSSSERVQRPLEGDGLIRSRPFIERDRWHHRLEIKVAGGRSIVVQEALEIRPYEGLPSGDRLADDGLSRCEREVRGDGGNRLNAGVFNSSSWADVRRGR